MIRYHLAQLNIAKARTEMTDEAMSGFVNRLNEINTLADQSSGFVWRLQSDDGDATSIRVFDDPVLLVNMSVWDRVSEEFCLSHHSRGADSGSGCLVPQGAELSSGTMVDSSWPYTLSRGGQVQVGTSEYAWTQ